MSKGLRGEHLRLFKQYAVGLILKSTLDKVPMELQQNKHKNDESSRNIGEDLLNRSTLLLSNMYIQCPHPIKWIWSSGPNNPRVSFEFFVTEWLRSVAALATIKIAP